MKAFRPNSPTLKHFIEIEFYFPRHRQSMNTLLEHLVDRSLDLLKYRYTSNT